MPHKIFVKFSQFFLGCRKFSISLYTCLIIIHVTLWHRNFWSCKSSPFISTSIKFRLFCLNLVTLHTASLHPPKRLHIDSVPQGIRPRVKFFMLVYKHVCDGPGMMRPSHCVLQDLLCFLFCFVPLSILRSLCSVGLPYGGDMVVA